MAKRVLIVEDNELNLKLFRDLLESQGYIVIGTHDGMEAMRLAREEKPDLVLMDIQLPEVSGLEVAKWIRDDANLSKTPIIAVTAFAMGEDDARVKASGCNAVMAKPISVKPFLELIAKTLSETVA